MLFDECKRLACAGAIADLTLLSLEGGIYLLQITTADQLHLLRDAEGRVWRLRSVEHARDLLRELPEQPFHLQHAEAHTEMCGMPLERAAPLRVPIAMRSGW